MFRITISQCFGFGACSLPFTYPGVPIFVGKPRGRYLLPIADKIKAKLVSWKGTLLFYMGCVQMINSVISGMISSVFLACNTSKNYSVGWEISYGQVIFLFETCLCSLEQSATTLEWRWFGFAISCSVKRSLHVETNVEFCALKFRLRLSSWGQDV